MSLSIHVALEGTGSCRSLVLYGEYNSRGTGANTAGRADFSRQLFEKEVEKFTKERILW